MVEAAIDRQVAPPIVGDALIFDRATGGEIARPGKVRSRAAGSFARRRTGLAVKNAFDTIGNSTIAKTVWRDCLPLKAMRKVCGIFRDRLDHVGERQLEGRVALVLEDVEAEGGVLCRQRRAVVPARLGPQMEGEAVPVLGDLDALGQQAVEGVGLVERRPSSAGRSTFPCAAARRRAARSCSSC